uniref:C-type lectin domain-containing protein n=1 Tax=Maylandia zebra TaxID=106582 RepID=A0A3P9AQW3_9CICH
MVENLHQCRFIFDIREKRFLALVVLQFYEFHNVCLKIHPFYLFTAKNTSYILVMENQTWSAAQSYCRTYHTDLTSIRSKEEKSNITLTLKGSGVQYVWIGLYRDPWAFWSDNTTSTFTNWMPSEPNNYNSIHWKWSMEGKLFYVGSTHEFLIWANGQPNCANANQYCVALQGQTQMNDKPCGDSYPFLCYNGRKIDCYPSYVCNFTRFIVHLF